MATRDSNGRGVALVRSSGFLDDSPLGPGLFRSAANDDPKADRKLMRAFVCRTHGCRVKFAALVVTKLASAIQTAGWVDGGSTVSSLPERPPRDIVALTILGPFALDTDPTAGYADQVLAEYALTGEPRSDAMSGLVIPVERLPDRLVVRCPNGHRNEVRGTVLRDLARSLIM